MRTAILALCLALVACTQFPDLDESVGPGVARAEFPKLIPLDPTPQDAAPTVDDTADTSRALEARVAALRARANALQRQTTDGG